MSVFVNALAIFGGGILLYAVYEVFAFLMLHFALPASPLRFYKRAGPDPAYALITGASAGIGFGIARELVNQGLGVILLGHLSDELVQAKKTLEKATPGAVVRTIVLNAQTATPAEMENAVRSIEDLQVSILINNVGGNPIQVPPLRELVTYSCADVDAVIDMNSRFMARLTALMIPVLTRKRGNSAERSLIINLSSAGHAGLPWLTLYAATKAFNLALSRSVSRELISSESTQHIDCLAVIPGDVLSQGNSKGVAKGSPTADEYGRCLVRTADNAIKRKMRDMSPYWLHDIQIRILPWLDENTRTVEMVKMVRMKKMTWDEHFVKTR